MNYNEQRCKCVSRHGFYIDVMEDGRFLCQLHYTKRGFPMVIDGKTVESYDFRDIEKFVYEKRPSLRNRNIHFEFSDNRV